MKKKILEVLLGSLKAKIITGVVSTLVVGGIVTGGIIYSNKANNDKQAEIKTYSETNKNTKYEEEINKKNENTEEIASNESKEKTQQDNTKVNNEVSIGKSNGTETSSNVGGTTPSNNSNSNNEGSTAHSSNNSPNKGGVTIPSNSNNTNSGNPTSGGSITPQTPVVKDDVITIPDYPYSTNYSQEEGGGKTIYSKSMAKSTYQGSLNSNGVGSLIYIALDTVAVMGMPSSQLNSIFVGKIVDGGKYKITSVKYIESPFKFSPLESGDWNYWIDKSGIFSQPGSGLFCETAYAYSVNGSFEDYKFGRIIINLEKM